MKYLLGEKLGFDWKILAVTVASTLMLILDRYHQWTAQKYLDRFILYLFVPLLVILVFFREDPRGYGFSLGDWRLGVTLTFIGILIAAPIIYYFGRGDEAVRAYYERFLPGLPWSTFLDLFGWEFFFRGWILFAYARKFGAEALWLQAVPFAIAHIGKPEVETLSTIFGGFIFGWVAWRTKSFIYPFLLHWFIGTFVILVAAGVV
ncbi:MAG TPA: type II CAAX endopeptidase family protein [Anaerolineales bacterium]|nr:type II CAAX endopeptidase family protein [Anaerolineales bacterium]HNO31598.1 type II CAAX endopeptidase family protein [Anaerolineales bacterium]